MKYKNLLLLLIFVVLTNACSTSKHAVHQNESIQYKIEELRRANELPGINCSIIFKDGRIEDYAVGYADVENNIPNHVTDKLLSGSIGKTYTVALLFQLIDAGKIKLDEKYLHYFPNHAWLHKLPNINEITIEMLLQHTSGLPRWVLKDEVWQLLHDQPDKTWSYRDRMSFVFDERPVHEAGKGWAYSDTNYILLGMIIEKFLDNGYYQSLHERILKPYKLTGTVPSNSRSIPQLIPGYSKLPEKFHIPQKTMVNGLYAFNPQVEWTGGGIASTAHDLARWCKLYFTGALFSKTHLQKMTVVNPNGHQVAGIHAYGMGCFIYDTSYGQAFGHSGFMPGYNAIMAYFPDKELAIAIQTNCDFASQKKDLVSYVEEIIGVLKVSE
jgi:D-alanyl-D-alanine carboxypeptidase